MILKTFGFIIVITSTSLIGFFYASKESFRISDLNEMKKALTILKSEIEYALSPLSMALLNISDKTKMPISNIFMQVSNEIEKRNGDEIFDIWQKSLQVNLKKTYLIKEDIEYFESFGKCLGYLDRQLQLNNIEITINYIKDKIDVLNVKSEKNKKMYNSLGILSGVLICILFI